MGATVRSKANLFNNWSKTRWLLGTCGSNSKVKRKIDMKFSEKHKHDNNISGLTLVEILVVIAIISILSGVFFVTTRTARESAKQVACVSQLSQIYKGLLLYSSDYDDGNLYPELHGLSYIGKPGYKFYPYIDPTLLICPTVPSAYRPKHQGSTYASGLFFPPVTSDGKISPVREVMIQSEKLLKGKLIVMECTAHDEFFFAPSEKDIDPAVAAPYKCLLHADGSTTKGRTNGPRDFPLTQGK